MSLFDFKADFLLSRNRLHRHFLFRNTRRCTFSEEDETREEKSIVADDNAIIEEFFDWRIVRRENWANKKHRLQHVNYHGDGNRR